MKQKDAIERRSVMTQFWKTAIAVCGFGAVGAFVFWSLYTDWLRLPIFATLTPEQTFIVMLAFLGLTFLALMAMLVVWRCAPQAAQGEQEHTKSVARSNRRKKELS